MRRWLLGLCLLWIGALQAAPVAVPTPLQGWRGWALDRQEFRECVLRVGSKAASADDYRCAWPGRLEVRADGQGAEFRIDWQLQAEAWVPLPGDEEYWPQSVRVDGQTVSVMKRGGVPQLRLPSGRHTIEGRFAWESRPQALVVPDVIAMISLQVDGQRIEPVRHDDGELVLGRGRSEAPEADAIDLRVYRRVDDGFPLMLETVIALRVSGQAREELVGPALPPGFVPTAMEIDSDWPLRLEADGRVRLQVQADEAELRVFARAQTDVDRLLLTATSAPWPSQEVWSFQSRPAQRVRHASGPPQVDPEQAGVPEEWLHLPAFALSADTPLQLELRSRGMAADTGNRLRLSREAWLDYSGRGWTFVDQIGGDMRQGWRLEAQAPLRIERAQDLIEDRGLLVTRGEGGGVGVEWRTPSVALQVGLRLEPASGRLPVHGWQQDFDAVTWRLHLPSGYRLVAAPGADHADTWVSNWSLLDVFVAAVVALLAWRSFGWSALAPAALYLLLSHREHDAPLLLLGLVLGLLLLARSLPNGRLQRGAALARRVAWLGLLLFALPFAAAQLRLALYPQLEGMGRFQWGIAGEDRQMGFSHATVPLGQAQEEAAAAAPAPPEEPPVVFDEPSPIDQVATQSESSVLDRIEVTGSRIKQSAMLDRYSESTVVQVGRGAPQWSSGRSHQLRISGPVSADQSLRLWLSPPWLTRSLRVLSVLALAWLVLRLADVRGVRLPLRGMAPAALILGLLVLPTKPVQAEDIPDAELRSALQARLTRAPACAPDCVDIAQAHVEIRGDRLRVALQAHAGHRTALPVPSDGKSLSLEVATIDGVAASGVGRDSQDLQLPIERGVRRVELQYRITGERVELAFPMPPHAVQLQADGWQGSGLSENRLLTETLVLSRLSAGVGDRPASGQSFPPYVRVRRTLSLGLDWSVYTEVERLSPAEGGFSVRLPLLPGEKVRSSNLKLRDGLLEVPVPDGESSVSWQSSLDKTDSLNISAPALSDRAEQWQVVVSPMWRAQFAGLPESVPEAQDPQDWHRFVFDPLPGETLAVSINRPQAAPGGSQAIESVRLSSKIGQRASDYELDLVLRASQGGERAIELPDASELLSVARDDESLSLRLEQGRLVLPVHPGSQHYQVRFRDAQVAGGRNAMPPIDLGLPAANIHLLHSLPADRWLLATTGPATGPAVLYWGELLVLIGLAWALSRLRTTPLPFRQWLLLGLGFSLFSWWALAAVVAWLLALAWRERAGAELAGKFRFNAMQLGLLLLTLIAALALVTAIPFGLLGRPDMHVLNPLGATQPLAWFSDQSEGRLPQASAISAPMWLYRTLMLAWALWLANALIGWVRWAFTAWSTGGYWRALRSTKAAGEADTEAVGGN